MFLFYQTTWSEIFKKVSIKQPGPSQKKLIVMFYFRAAMANFWSLLGSAIKNLGLFSKSPGDFRIEKMIVLAA